MSVPGIVHSTLNGEEIAARVSLGGEDELFITPSSTLVYRSDGLLSDESVDEYPHDADRLTLSEGRRKTTFTLEYPLEGTEEFTIPSGKTNTVLHPVLAGVLNGNGITDPGETVAQTYRFSELTLIITSDRLVKHIGAAVWDGDYEEYHYDDVTNLAFEDGSVATQIVLTANGRPQRIKAPNDQANDLRERLKRALFEYHDVGSLEELNETLGADDDTDGSDHGTVDFGDGVAPLDANPPEPDEEALGNERVGESAAEAGSPSAEPLGDDTATAGAGPDVSAPSQTNAQQSRSEQSGQQTGSQSTSVEQQRTAAEPASDSAAMSEADTTFEMSTDVTSESAADSEASGTADTDTSHDDHDVATDRDILEESTSLLESDAQTNADTASDADGSQGTDPELLERIESLEAAVEQQSELVERQQQTIEQLILELRESR